MQDLIQTFRYKYLEKLAAEEYEKELRSRSASRGRSDLPLNLEGSSTVPVPQCVSPGSADSQEEPSTPATSCGALHTLEVSASDPECEPEVEPEGEAKPEQGKKEAGTPHEAEAAEAEPESEVEQGPEQESEDGSVLSEKERQNEEVNEKDNCSASSISSASSTLEREDKLTSDNETGTVESFFPIAVGRFCNVETEASF
uniref:Uncharacterized protein n=1 Tax=Sphaerodactylus townsendi TaxID=933632 RepID=A0ACB8FUS1_9SAUR